jgi:hypothetical protein
MRLPLRFAHKRHDIVCMKQLMACLLAAAALALAQTAYADECSAQLSQTLEQKGYTALDQQRWDDAKMAAGELVLSIQDCNNPEVQIPSTLHGAYIGAMALHHLGEDTKASEAAQNGLLLLDVLHNNGDYADLYKELRPKFAALLAEIRT